MTHNKTNRNSSVSIAGDAVGNVIASGDHNSISANINAKLNKIELPPPDSVNILTELNGIRSVLEQLSMNQRGKISRAIDDAIEEAEKPEPSKDEIGAALKRALEYAKTSSAFAEQIEKIVPYVTKAVAWLGSNWYKLLPIVGLAI